MKLFLILLSIWVVTLAQVEGNESTDTSNVTGLIGTSTVYSKAFNLSGAENLTIETYANDPDVPGIANDSIHFATYIEFGRKVGSSYIWYRSDPLFLDTMNTTVGTRFAITPRVISDDYTFSSPQLTIDTLASSGWALQKRVVIPEAAGVFRLKYVGLTNNNKGSSLQLLTLVWRRAFIIARPR